MRSAAADFRAALCHSCELQHPDEELQQICAEERLELVSLRPTRTLGASRHIHYLRQGHRADRQSHVPGLPSAKLVPAGHDPF